MLDAQINKQVCMPFNVKHIECDSHGNTSQKKMLVVCKNILKL
jgi:hypothetical protein